MTERILFTGLNRDEGNNTTDTMLETDMKDSNVKIYDRKHPGGIITYRNSRLRVLKKDKNKNNPSVKHSDSATFIH